MGLRLRRLINAAVFLRLAASILLSFIIWGFIVWETNPERTRQFSGVVPVSENIPADMLIVGELPEVTVSVKGPQDIVRVLVASDFQVTIDFQNASGPGIDEYAVAVDAPSGLRQVTVEPSAIEVELDRIVTESLPVEMREAEPRPLSVTEVSLSTERVALQGPKALVDRVEAVEVPLVIGSRDESFVEDVTPIALDSLGERVQGVNLTPSTIEVAVTFETTSKDVAVLVICACVEDGQLQEIELEDASPIPSTVRISGTASVLDGIESIRTVPIDTAGLESAGWILDVELDLADVPGAVTLSEQAVDVWIPVDPGRQQISEIPIGLLNADPEFSVRLAAPTVTVVVSGTVDDVRQLDPASLKAVVDVAGLAPGNYTLDIQVVLPPGLTYENVEPATVQVTVERAAQIENQINELGRDPLQTVR
jgi:YbbR domain-containing protein